MVARHPTAAFLVGLSSERHKSKKDVTIPRFTKWALFLLLNSACFARPSKLVDTTVDSVDRKSNSKVDTSHTLNVTDSH